jgi:3D (Asp-Asp-Asp) domain-containing protein
VEQGVVTRRRVLVFVAVYALVLAAIAYFAGRAESRVEYFAAHSTSYCLNGVMADGTRTRARSAASNRHPLGTRIVLTKPGPGGIRRWVIRDRIGWGSQLDFWAPTCWHSRQWGRRHVTYRIERSR